MRKDDLNDSFLNAWGAVPAEVKNHTLQSSRWRALPPRSGDIVIATWAKSGTTWVQQIVAQLMFQGDCTTPLTQLSPWFENPCFPLESMCAVLNAQEHRRILKTHLPATALPFYPGTKYIFIGRDGRDAIWSWHHHHMNLTELVYELMSKSSDAATPPLDRPKEDQRLYFLDWMHRDGYPLWPFWSHVRSWWDLRDRENVLLLHFDEMKRDLRGAIVQVATFLGFEPRPELLDGIVHRCSFSYMNENAEALIPGYSRGLRGGAETFMHRGSGGAWQDVLVPDDILQYEREMASNLDVECARWLSQPYTKYPS
jgi:aryl sulfotransferase